MWRVLNAKGTGNESEPGEGQKYVKEGELAQTWLSDATLGKGKEMWPLNRAG